MDKVTYRISERLHVSGRYVVYRAINEQTNVPVILKSLKETYPSAQAINQLNYEFSVLQQVQCATVVKPLVIESFENRLAIVFDSAPGIPLASITAGKPIALSLFFAIARPLTQTVQTLHRQRIIHKNITPSNILFDSDSQQLTLCGFSKASELSRGGTHQRFQETLDGNLAYISPEQTGRMNRTLDHRSDLYAMGCLFYELLTARPPFASDDPMEMVHAHIALPPKPPHTLVANLPTVVAQIVLRLLAKSPEDRYQSATGLLIDLERCQTSHSASGQIPEFTIGTNDVSDQFQLPEKLYGRTQELNQLLRAFQQARTGQADVVLIGGYSGVGKSGFVQELRKTITQAQGLFIVGKFDQFKRDIPLSSLLAAFRELIRQLLTQTDEQIARWRQKVGHALGQSAQILIDVVPDLALLIGPQPDVPDLPPVEANNRFNQLLTVFLDVFIQPEHPLCIFLDDLQWIDSATRQWLEIRLSNRATNHLLFVGAYRDNEVTASHPLMLLVDRLRQNGVTINQISLQPLPEETLAQLVADTLRKTADQCTDLTEVIFQKTAGNPFFIRQCLLSLYEQGAIYFDPEQQIWAYAIDAVRQTQLSDNVVDLMAGLIQRLPANVQHLLKTAACIGNQFDVPTLSLVSEQSLDETTSQLAIALQQGLIVPSHTWQTVDVDEFAFLHDRVQQAALSLLDEGQKQQIRLHIGRLLLQNATSIDQASSIYDIADHLNVASHLIDDPTEKQRLVEVNLAASIRAKNSSAYEPALRYCQQAMELLPIEAWEHPSALTRELLLQRAESEHLCGNNQLAETYFDQAITHATAPLDRARIYQHKIHYYTNLGKFDLAYQTGREAVGQLGVTLPASFFPPAFAKDLITYQLLMGNKKVEDISTLKDMTDERLKMAILLMASFVRAAYQIKPELCIAVCTRMVNICLRHGNTDGGSNGFLAFGPIFMGAIINRKQTGFDFGQLTLALVEKFKSLTYKAEAYFVVGYFAIPWRRPATEMERYWQIAYEAGLETGDLFHASCSCCGTIQSYYMRGMKFGEILSASDRYLEFLNRIHNKEAILTIQGIRQAIRNLRGETESSASFSDATFNEADYLTELAQFGTRHFAHYYFINKMQTAYLWGNHEQAYKLSIQSDQYLKDSPGMLHTAEHYFYKGLIICALYPESIGLQRVRWRRTLTRINTAFRKYTAGSPSNFVHKWQLLDAEISRVMKDMTRAERLYAAAIESAKQADYTQIQAMASEALGRLHNEAGHHREAGFHLRNAAYTFRKLGATAYADVIRQRYPTLFDALDDEERNNGADRKSGITGLVKTGGDNLDLSTILKSSEAISREIRLPDLLSTMMKIIIENAGGQRMVFLLQQGHELVVQAEYLAESSQVNLLNEIPLSEYSNVPRTVVNYAARTQEPVLLDVATGGDYANDAYILAQQPRSILCAPLIQLGKLIGVIYLENNLVNAAFTQERINLLLVLSGQMAISIENALLYKNLEEKVNERTAELHQSLEDLKTTQVQLVQKEKMASLGELTAGIAHEIQNPLNFVNNFSEVSVELIHELKEEALAGNADDVLAIADDLTQNLEKIAQHGGRASSIIKGMLEHSRTNTGERQVTDLNTLTNEYVRLAYQGLVAKDKTFSCDLVTAFDPDLGMANVVPQEIGRVLLNVVNNAFYAVSDKKKQQVPNYQPTVSISTRRWKNQLEIRVKDNGTGIPDTVKGKIFQPFFTTKPTGEGTGLGLSISYDIITKGHAGSLLVDTETGQFTELTICLPVTVSGE